MSAAAVMKPGLSRTVSQMRLAVAMRAMERAESLQAVIRAKDHAKGMGLLPADMDTLRAEFDRAKARFR